MSITAIISALNLADTVKNFVVKNFPWILAAALLVALIFSVKTCRKEKDIVNDYKRINQSQVNNLFDKHQQETILLTKNTVITDSLTKSLMDSLEIKNRQLKSIKTVTINKTVTKYITDYDTLYEFIELSQAPTNFSTKLDDCMTVRGEFTPSGLVLTGKRSIEILDFNYAKRKKLWNVKILPRLGRKEHFQTLVTSCGDTVLNNTKLIFDK